MACWPILAFLCFSSVSANPWVDTRDSASIPLSWSTPLPTLAVTSSTQYNTPLSLSDTKSVESTDPLPLGSVSSQNDAGPTTSQSAEVSSPTSAQSTRASSTVLKAQQEFYMPEPTAWPIYKTEPSFMPEYFDIMYQTENKSLLAPGYFFIDPTYGHPKDTNDPGPWSPQIYDQSGELIFHGREEDIHSQNSHVCDYKGTKGIHICVHQRLGSRHWSASSKQFGIATGANYVLDQTYSVAGEKYTTELDGFGPNGHEFQMVDNGYGFLQPIELIRSRDLTEFSGPKDGWVVDGCFEEVSIASGAAAFSWCWSEYLPLWTTALFFKPDPDKEQANLTSPRAGRGDRDKPWDFAHLNSMDKNDEGDYLVSARHADSIVKIAGPYNVHGLEPGTVIWRLGGEYSDFEMHHTPFSKQHGVRFISTGSHETVISMLDNAFGGDHPPTRQGSAGLIIKVNNSSMESHVVHEYAHPDNLSAESKGSMQLISSNGNVVVGWGNIPSITEYSHNSTVLYHMRYTAGMMKRTSDTDSTHIEQSYRAYKQPWIGKPHWKPRLLAYSRTCRNSPLVAYVSWNGATEVHTWRFYSKAVFTGSRKTLGSFAKRGFETKVKLSGTYLGQRQPRRFNSRLYVEGLDASGKVLGRTSTWTFVPTPKYAASFGCDLDGCKPDRFEYDMVYSVAGQCSQLWQRVIALVIFTVITEGIAKVWFLTYEWS